MTPDDHACLAVDLGGATASAALLARIEGHWRLLGGLSMPATIPIDAIVATLAARLEAADPTLAWALDAGDAVARWPRVVVRTGRAPRLAVLGPTERTTRRLVESARRAGWLVSSAAAEHDDPLAMTRLILRRDVSAVLVGASDPPATDERPVLAELAELVAAAAGRRPELTVVLSGSLADHATRFERPIGEGGATPARLAARTDGAAARTDGAAATTDGAAAAIDRAAAASTPAGTATTAPAALLLAPAPTAGQPAGEALRLLLDELRAEADDGRRGIVRATGDLASHFERRLETVDIGTGAGLRVVARPAGGGGPVNLRWATVAEAALVPDPVDDDVVDGVLGWSTLPLDRYRMRDRLADLRLAPWSDAAGEGAMLRLAAARAALGRLAARTPDLDRPMPDLLIAAGGAWAAAPGPAVGLALADVLRRSGACQMAFDHARLLGPIGSIADPALRMTILADVADDMLAPLGSVVIPSGLRPGRSLGQVVVTGASGTTELELVPGGLELVDLPPGAAGTADFRFRDTVTLGTRGKRFSVEVGGGLGGLLIDLRDVPLHLPDRAERRRELLDAWQRALWAGL